MAKELMCFPSLPLLGRKVGNYICWLISDQAAAHSLSPSLLSRPHSLPLPLPSSLLWLPVAGLQNSTRQAGSTAVSLSLSLRTAVKKRNLIMPLPPSLPLPLHPLGAVRPVDCAAAMEIPS